MRILRFGGTALASAKRIREVVEIVGASRQHRPVLVAAALDGVSDALRAAAESAARGSGGYQETFVSLERRHLAAVDALALPAEHRSVCQRVLEGLGELRKLLEGISLLGECSPRTLDSIWSYGPRLAVEILAAALRRGGIEAGACDPRGLIVTDACFGRARVDSRLSEERLREHLRRPPIQVMSGGIGATPEGETTTLGPGGADLTAALAGVATGAERVEIWTDAEGVMSADPHLVPQAFALPELSYDELMELSPCRARGVHTPALQPLRAAGIPLWIRSSRNPELSGTQVRSSVPPSPHPVRGLSSIHRVALLRLQGDGLAGIPAVAMRLLSALAGDEIRIVLLSQAASERSICLALEPSAVERARRRLEDEFAAELGAGTIDELVIEGDLSILAAVGEAMRQRPGIAGRILRVLGDAGINVRAIAQGSSELNLSLVIDGKEESRALQAVHGALLLPDARVVSLFLAGLGKVGRALLEILGERALRAGAEEARLRLAGLANGERMLLAADGLAPNHGLEALDRSAVATDLGALAEAAMGQSRGGAIVVDCTGGEDLAPFYEPLVAAGVSVVTSNPLPLWCPMAQYRRLAAAAHPGGARLACEPAVGGGLPVLRTLRELRRAGDRILGLEAVLSALPGFLCDRLAEGLPFSTALRLAFERGYASADPRREISGQRVAARLLVLCREAGWKLEPEAIEVQSLLPDASWLEMPVERFWKQLQRLDASFAERCGSALAATGRWRYLASAAVAGEAPRVRLQSCATHHPGYAAQGTDQLVAITSAVYADAPLVLRGPGNDPRVTAAALWAEIRAAVES